MRRQGGAQVVRPELSSSDLQFLENRKFSRSEICAAFGIPEEIVTTTDKSKYDVMQGSRLNFIENRVVPLCRRLEAEEEITVKTIDPNADNPSANPKFSADGIYFDPSDERVYIGSHPTKDLIVLDSHDGKVLGKIPLDGIPEQTISDGKGTLYAVLQDSAGSVAVVDQKTMKTTKHYPFGDVGRCNGLALDVKNSVLFAACAQGRTPGQPPSPVMVMSLGQDFTPERASEQLKWIVTEPLYQPLLFGNGEVDAVIARTGPYTLDRAWDAFARRAGRKAVG